MVKTMPMFAGAEYQELFDIMLSITKWQFLLLILAEAASFAGALIMLWKLKSIGFHIYTIGQILEFCTLNFIIGGKLTMTFSAVIMTVLIIVMYATQLRYMKDPPAKDNNNEEPINKDE